MFDTIEHSFDGHTQRRLIDHTQDKMTLEYLPEGFDDLTESVLFRVGVEPPKEIGGSRLLEFDRGDEAQNVVPVLEDAIGIAIARGPSSSDAGDLKPANSKPRRSDLPTVPVEWRIAGAGDFNGDGFADLVWEDTITGQRAIWLLKNGVFSGVINLPTVPVEWHIAGVGDFNGDGFADLVWEDTITGQRAIWLLKNGVISSSSVNLPTVPVASKIEDH
jgi:FG-GAP-like repeat